MKKKILSALLAVSLVAGTIVGCSSDKASDGESSRCDHVNGNQYAYL